METPKKQFSWPDFFSFKFMISLSVIQIVYLIGAIGISLVGLAGLFTGYGMGVTGHLSGLLLIIFGNLFWRIWSELLIIFFRMNETLNSIDFNTKRA